MRCERLRRVPAQHHKIYPASLLFLRMSDRPRCSEGSQRRDGHQSGNQESHCVPPNGQSFKRLPNMAVSHRQARLEPRLTLAASDHSKSLPSVATPNRVRARIIPLIPRPLNEPKMLYLPCFSAQSELRMSRMTANDRRRPDENAGGHLSRTLLSFTRLTG